MSQLENVIENENPTKIDIFKKRLEVVELICHVEIFDFEILLGCERYGPKLLKNIHFVWWQSSLSQEDDQAVGFLYIKKLHLGSTSSFTENPGVF